MQAIVRHTYGSPDVLALEEVKTPVPGPDDVLIRVRAASINAADWHVLRGAPFFMRFMGFGIFIPKHKILGCDISGRVEAVGKHVTQFQVGDEVLGDISDSGFGAFADYLAVPESAALALKPTEMTFEQAAAVPLAGITALQGLRDRGRLQAGQTVLIHGAGGGVGTLGVQIAKALGAEVTGVTKTSSLDMVRSAGADHVIDYTLEDCTQNGKQYDVILDTGAYRSILDFKGALTPTGRYVMVGGSVRRMFQIMFLGPWLSRGKRSMGIVMAKSIKKDMEFLRGLMESGKITPIIDRRYSLEDVPKAIRYVEEGRARGKVVIQGQAGGE